MAGKGQEKAGGSANGPHASADAAKGDRVGNIDRIVPLHRQLDNARRETDIGADLTAKQ